jgi:hypothetical protein
MSNENLKPQKKIKVASNLLELNIRDEVVPQVHIYFKLRFFSSTLYSGYEKVKTNRSQPETVNER